MSNPIVLTAQEAAEADWLSSLRLATKDLTAARADLKPAREASSLYGSPVTLSTGTFVGKHGDLTNADVVTGLAVLDAMEALLIDPATHLPTDALKALMKFARYS